jgi:predicted alpha/beta-hydrolase family hydrolase
VRFEFAYMARARTGAKRGAPDRMPVLERTFEEVLSSLGSAKDWLIGGKSMGGRVATRIADRLGVCGVVAYGYPFHPPKKPGELRTEHLKDLRTPCLILQGTRDALGSREEVLGYELSKSIECTWLDDGDHSFEPRKSSGRSFAQNLAQALEATLAFAQRLG